MSPLRSDRPRPRASTIKGSVIITDRNQPQRRYQNITPEPVYSQKNYQAVASHLIEHENPLFKKARDPLLYQSTDHLPRIAKLDLEDAAPRTSHQDHITFQIKKQAKLLDYISERLSDPGTIKTLKRIETDRKAKENQENPKITSETLRLLNMLGSKGKNQAQTSKAIAPEHLLKDQMFSNRDQVMHAWLWAEMVRKLYPSMSTSAKHEQLIQANRYRDEPSNDVSPKKAPSKSNAGTSQRGLQKYLKLLL